MKTTGLEKPLPSTGFGIESLDEKAEQLDALLVFISASFSPWSYTRQSQLGLYYIAQHATDHGFQVKIDNVSANDHIIKRTKRLLKAHNCSVLGFYVDHENVWFVRRVVEQLKQELSDLIVVLGGPQLTGAPERTMDQIPGATIGAIAEGEETFLELLTRKEFTVTALSHCKGIIFRSEYGFVKTKPRLPINIDSLSVPRRKELTIDGRYDFHPKMITGRGCTGHCAFCYEGVQRTEGRRLRMSSVEKCLNEFDYLVEEFGEKYKYISILDDTFVASPKRVREFCRVLYEKHGGAFKWFCEARADTLHKNRDLLPVMVEAGLARIQLGGESGNQDILNAYSKGTTLDQLREVVRAAAESGLFSIFANFIIGGAHETEETAEDTIRFAVELLEIAPGVIEVGASTFSPCAGTPMTLYPEEYGIQIEDLEMIMSKGDRHSSCRTETLSRHKIMALKEKFDQVTQEAMRQIAGSLKREKIAAHFHAQQNYGIQTQWYTLFCENTVLKTYYKAMFSDNLFLFEEALEKDFDLMYPMRTVELVSSLNERFLTATINGRVREFDKLESIILELSSSKINFEEMIDIFQSKMNYRERHEIRDLIIEKFRQLDSEHYIIWRSVT